MTGFHNLFISTALSTGVVPVVSQNFLLLNSNSTVPSWLNVSGITGQRMVYDSTGTLTYAPNNLYLNSGAAGSTARTITTVAGVNYYIWIQTSSGSATIVATGTNTSTFNGSAGGTFTAFTATAGTLTLTPTSNFANITQVVVAQITYESALRAGDNVVTSAAAYYGPRFDSPNGVAAGLLVEESRTNYAYYSLAPGLGSYSNLTASIASGVTDITGGTNGITVTAVAGTGGHYSFKNAMASLTSATVYTVRVVLKQGTAAYTLFGEIGGTNYVWGSVKWSDLSVTTNGQDSSSIKAPVNLGNGFYQVDMTFTADSTHAAYFAVGPYNQTAALLGNNAPSWSAAGTETAIHIAVQIEAGAFGTSLIPTTTSSVTRVADIIKLSGAASTAIQGAAWSHVIEVNLPNTSPVPVLLGGANAAPALGYFASATQASDFDISSGVTNIQATAGSGGWTPGRVAYGSTSGANRSMVFNAGTVATAASGIVSSRSNINLGSYNVPANFLNGWVRGFSIYNSRLPDATLQSKSTVGGAY